MIHARLALASIAVGGAIAAAVIAAPTASADATDTAFLAALDAQGITYPTPSHAIAAGLSVCAHLDAGYAPATIATELYSDNNITMYNAGYLVGAGVAAYCPEYTWMLSPGTLV